MGFNILGSGGAGGAGISPTATARLYDDFLVDVGLFTSYASGTGASIGVSTALNDKDHPGQIRGQTGTTTTGIWTKYAAQPIIFGNGFNFKTSIRLVDLSTAGEEFDLRVGIKEDVTTGVQSHGIYFLYDRNANTNWLAVCDDDTGTTTTDTGVAVVEDAWVNLSITMNSSYTSCDFSINGTSVATNSTVANFPDSGTDVGYAQVSMEKSAGTTSRLTYVDYILLDATVSR